MQKKGNHKKTISYVPVGVFTYNTTVGLLCVSSKLLRKSLWVYWSKNGTTFSGTPEKITITLPNKRLENIGHCHNFSISKVGQAYVLTYTRNNGRASHLVTAVTKTIHHWKVVAETPHIKQKAIVVPDYFKNDKHLMYTGGLFVGYGFFTEDKQWNLAHALLFTSRAHNFDHGELALMGSYITPKGILVVYDATYKDKDTYVVQAGAVLFDSNDPGKIIWRAEMPIWKELVDVTDEKIYPLGAIVYKKELVLFWTTSTKMVLKAAIPALFLNYEEKPEHEKIALVRHHKNPVMLPLPHNEWESEAVFNPAAFYDNGEVHLIYRAIGGSGISVFGYSASHDCYTFDNRLSHPVFEPTRGFDMPLLGKTRPEEVYNPNLYGSGGGWAGCEDPRAVKIGNRVYVTYVAFSGWDSIRIALTSISLSDFRKKKWNWKKPVYLSPPKQTHKNWVLFPEKINGKFAILHGITPNIMIDYVDDLDNVDKYITSERAQGPQPGRQGFWDGRVRGVGPPPIKTKLGWLVLYHANDQLDPSRYKLGAMVLDLHDPRKVLYRTSRPILSPEMYYENEGKPGIVYASGAIIKDDKLYVYYGGGDRVVCVATANIDEFLGGIVKDISLPLNTFKNVKLS